MKTTFNTFVLVGPGKYAAEFIEVDGRTFKCDQNSLAIRIANMKAQGLDISTESAALVELRKRNA